MASVYIRRQNQILLLCRQGSSIVKNLWIGSAGGHFEENELNDARACVLRELEEELSLFEKDLENLTLRYVTVRYADGELRQNYYFFADLSDSNKIFLPFPHNNSSDHFIFNTEIRSVPRPVIFATASTIAKRTVLLSAPWQTTIAPI